MPEPSWNVYIVRCGDGSLYTGIATDVARRVGEHAAGGRRSARFLRGRGPLELLLEHPVGKRGLAQQVESRIKRLPKLRKEALVACPEILEDLIRPLREAEPEEREETS